MTRHYFPHIYFEAARPRTRDSVTQAVHEMDSAPGVSSFGEYKRVAFAQLADYVDGWTVNHRGEIIPFTVQRWKGRTLVLIRLGKKRWPKKYHRVIEIINHYRRRIIKQTRLNDRVKLLLEAAKKLGISQEEARKILRKVRQKKFSI